MRRALASILLSIVLLPAGALAAPPKGAPAPHISDPEGDFKAKWKVGDQVMAKHGGVWKNATIVSIKGGKIRVKDAKGSAWDLDNDGIKPVK